jgi:hypothetical protein
MPLWGARMLVGGYLGGCAAAVGQAVYGKGKTPFDEDGIDDRAYSATPPKPPIHPSHVHAPPSA